jgi:hypothetical protein
MRPSNVEQSAPHRRPAKHSHCSCPIGRLLLKFKFSGLKAGIILKMTGFTMPQYSSFNYYDFCCKYHPVLIYPTRSVVLYKI